MSPVPLPGAVLLEGPDGAVAAHCGDPLREQRLMEGAAALVDRSNRDVVRVGGADRLGWLHSLTTQHLSALPPGAATEALVLDPHGRVEHHLVLHDDGVAVWADLEPGTAPALVGWLETMRFLLRVEVDVPPVSVLALVGPAAAQVAAQAGLPWPEPGSSAAAGEVMVRARRHPASAVDLLVPTAQAAELASSLLAAGAAPAGLWAWEALRVAARQPRLGWETDHRTIPHEVGWIDSAVHLDKGCYRGQETVARVHNLGRPPRRLVLVHLDGSQVQLPPHGAALTWEGAPVGFVGTSARHYELGPIALAVVKRSVPDTAQLQADGVAAAIDADPTPLSAPAGSARPERPGRLRPP